MKKLMEFAVCFFCLLAVVYGCSEPEGGFQKPTPASNVFYSEHVVIGNVTEIIRPDPMFGEAYGNSTYGAMVTVKCTYKGGPLPGRIQIGGAGFVPGLCFSKDLEKGKEYVLFLSKKQQNDDMYEQSEAPESTDKLMGYLNVCDLRMQYPQENGMALKRKICPPVSHTDTCKRYSQQTGKVETVSVKHSPSDMQDQKKPSAGKSGTDGNNSAVTVMTSLSAMFVCVLIQLL